MLASLFVARVRIKAAIAAVRTKNEALVEDLARRRADMVLGQTQSKRATNTATKVNFHLRATQRELETVREQVHDAEGELSKLQAELEGHKVPRARTSRGVVPRHVPAGTLTCRVAWFATHVTDD